MGDLRRYWMNRPTLNCSKIFVLGAAALLVACDRADAPTEIPLPDNQQPQFVSNDHSPNANPFTFVGREDACASPPTVPDYPAGSRIVSAAWLGGMGLPDNGGPNAGLIADPADAPNKDDPHYGLLLSKNGNSAICASAGASIVGVKGLVVDADFALGFDYRNGTHCGAGAPRFNVVVKNSVTNTQTFHFVGGCANGTKEPAPQDLLEWTRVQILPTVAGQSFPVIPVNSTIVAITLLYDEGTENENPLEDARGVGLAVVDNINIDGKEIRSGGGIAFGAGGLEKKDSDSDGLADETDTDDDNDGLEDFLDTDDNGDGIEDLLELNLTLSILKLPSI